MANYSSFALRLQKAWQRCQAMPAGERVFSLLVGKMVPYSGSIGARITELAPGKATVVLPDRRKVRNHLRSIHAIAMVNLGEMATGIALNSGLPADTRAILVKIEMEYLKKARGELSVSCQCQLPTDNSAQDWPIQADIKDSSGDTVASCTATWRVGA